MRAERAEPYPTAGTGGHAPRCRDEEQVPLPSTLHVNSVGRERGARKGNVDIFGEYALSDRRVNDRPVYEKVGSSNILIYFNHDADAWMLTRNGNVDFTECAAFANDVPRHQHPGHAHLVWYVYDKQAGAHVQDVRMMVTDAPYVLSCVGWASEHGNGDLVNGEYKLTGKWNSKPFYVHQNNTTSIRYDDGQWLISTKPDSGRECSAYSDALNIAHPGHAALQWHVHNPHSNCFVIEPRFGVVMAPSRIELIGEPSQICGTYILAKVQEHRPVYVCVETQTVIQYDSKTERWNLSQAEESPARPNLLNRLYQFVVGMSGADSGRCIAYADSCIWIRHGLAALHPAAVAGLEWHVFNSNLRRFEPARLLRAIVGPRKLRVQNARVDLNDISGIYGEYEAASTFAGRAAYHKVGTPFVIRFSADDTRWMIVDGLEASGRCVAYTSNVASFEHPVGSGPWHIYVAEAEVFSKDKCLSVVNASESEQPHGPFNTAAAGGPTGSAGTTEQQCDAKGPETQQPLNQKGGEVAEAFRPATVGPTRGSVGHHADGGA